MTGRYEVDAKGYITGTLAPNELVFDAPVGEKPINLKAAFRLKNFVKGRYVVHMYTKKGLPYIGKALESLIKRYGSEERVAELGVDVIKGLDNLPNNAVALGVEQLVIDLNGGIGTGKVANVINATIKEIYINEARYWLETNIPNWKQVLKFQ